MTWLYSYPACFIYGLIIGWFLKVWHDENDRNLKKENGFMDDYINWQKPEEYKEIWRGRK